MGHTGTLDPFATGLLVLLTGRATRLARFLEQQPKTYLATARLGFATTTDDPTGEMIGEVGAIEAITGNNLAAALAGMVGEQQQVPSTFSAKKVAGERSYRKARRGEPVRLAPVPITIEDIQLVSFAPPFFSFRAIVSPGTYIRALARDLGRTLEVGAHLTALRREAIGGLNVEDAIPLESLDRGTPLTPLRAVLSHIASVELELDECAGVAHGRPVRRISGAAPFVLLTRNEVVIALARVDGEWLRPVVVLEGL